MADRPRFPPFTRTIVISAVVLDVIVFTGLSRAGLIVALMMVANLSVCLLIYWAILGQFFNGKMGEMGKPAQSPSRKSSPISE